jgi:hypothetical protein
MNDIYCKGSGLERVQNLVRDFLRAPPSAEIGLSVGIAHLTEGELPAVCVVVQENTHVLTAVEAEKLMDILQRGIEELGGTGVDLDDLKRLSLLLSTGYEHATGKESKYDTMEVQVSPVDITLH